MPTAQYLLLFLRREVILNVEDVTNLLRGFVSNHAGDVLARQIQQAFNVQEVGSLS
jgi:hypothetical protein